MLINTINQIDYEISDTQTNLFSQITIKTKELLQLDKQYVLSLIIVDDVQIQEINRSYRQIDRATDVISFASQEGEVFDFEDEVELGDIFISIDKMKAQAAEYGHSEEREFSFLFTHGLLHLLGYDHMNVEEEEKMFQLQDVILHGIINKEI